MIKGFEWRDRFLTSSIFAQVFMVIAYFIMPIDVLVPHSKVLFSMLIGVIAFLAAYLAQPRKLTELDRLRISFAKEDITILRYAASILSDGHAISNDIEERTSHMVARVQSLGRYLAESFRELLAKVEQDPKEAAHYGKLIEYMRAAQGIIVRYDAFRKKDIDEEELEMKRQELLSTLRGLANEIARILQKGIKAESDNLSSHLAALKSVL